ncbi:hypothetical protein [Saccharothrix sp. HUAS TT1]|uniref:hypothetical protein n=1 Tax=unclassified Saccharothrix TaxID=2593673 RepID=UPI00345BE5EA
MAGSDGQHDALGELYERATLLAALDRMPSNPRANLAPGGRLVVLAPNPCADWDVPADYARR